MSSFPSLKPPHLVSTGCDEFHRWLNALLARGDEDDDALLNVSRRNLSEQRAVGSTLMGVPSPGLEHEKCMHFICRRRSDGGRSASGACAAGVAGSGAKRGLWQVEQAHHRALRCVLVPVGM